MPLVRYCFVRCTTPGSAGVESGWIDGCLVRDDPTRCGPARSDRLLKGRTCRWHVASCRYGRVDNLATAIDCPIDVMPEDQQAHNCEGVGTDKEQRAQRGGIHHAEIPCC